MSSDDKENLRTREGLARTVFILPIRLPKEYLIRFKVTEVFLTYLAPTDKENQAKALKYWAIYHPIGMLSVVDS